jgi:hypothetical protein
MREEIFTEKPGKVKIVEVNQKTTVTCTIVADFIYSVKEVKVDEDGIETTKYKAKVDRQVFDNFPILPTSAIEAYLSSVWTNKYAPLEELDSILSEYPSLSGKVLT